MKVLITGGGGFIGLNTAKKFFQLGHEVVLFDMKVDTDRLRSISEDLRFIEKDIGDLEALTRCFRSENPNVIVHLPALRNLQSQQEPFKAHLVNSTGMVNMLEAAWRAKVPRVVYASSVAVYGSPAYYRSLNLNPSCVTERMPPNPYNVYGCTKLYDEMMAFQYGKIYGLTTIGLRISIVFGPGKTLGSKTSEFNDVIESPFRKEATTINSFGDQKVNLIYLPDVVHGIVCACLAADPISPVYNLGGYSITSRELVDAVRKLQPNAHVSLTETDQEREVASAIDISLAKEELGYEPQLSLEKSIESHHNTISNC